MRTHLLLFTLLAAAPANAEPGTLFDALGGRPAVDRIVATAFDIFIHDPRVRDDFDNIAPDFFRGRLADHLCVVTDGPCTYKGRAMGPAHKGLGLSEAKFNAVAEDLQEAMQRQGVPYHTQNRVLARLAPMHRDIVTR